MIVLVNLVMVSALQSTAQKLFFLAEPIRDKISCFGDFKLYSMREQWI